MCCIVIAQSRHLPLEDFNEIWNANNDGLGFAYFKNDKVYFKKGFLKAQEAYDAIKDLPLPHCIHFRKQSIGVVSEKLTHPFIVSKDSPLDLEGEVDSLLFHNGTENTWALLGAAAGIYLSKDEISSDSRMIARIAHDNTRFLETLNSKFVIGDINKKNKQGGNTFFYYGDFTEVDGLWYSNLFWKHSKKKTQTSEIIGPNRSYYKFGESNTTNIYSSTSNDTFNRISNHKFSIYEYPWNRFGNCEVITRVPWERSMGFRYMMNKITVKAAQKIWKKLCQKKHFNFEKAEENALKIMRQQGKGNLNGIDKWLERQKNKENDKIIIEKTRENEEKIKQEIETPDL